MRKSLLFLLLVCFALWALGFQEPQEGPEKPHLSPSQNPLYTLIDLGPTTLPTENIGPAINNQGVVVAWRPTKLNERPVAWVGDFKQQRFLGHLPNSPNTYAAAINDSRQVVGIAKSLQDIRHMRPFLWQNGTLRDLGGLGGPFGAALAINQRGDVAGYSQLPSGATHAFLYHNGVLQDLGVLPHGDFSAAEGINNKGVIVGVSNTEPHGKTRAFGWARGKMKPLPNLPGGSFSHAHAVNDAGEIVGWADTPEGEIHACLWRQGSVLDLGTLGDSPSSAWGINQKGQIVGSSSDRYQHPHAFLWEKGHMEDLNRLIPNNTGWILQRAFAINEKGEIVGTGRVNGETHVFLLQPNKKVASKPQAPNFELVNLQGLRQQLRSYRWQPVALFFFCGCNWCHSCAKAWADIQKSGRLSTHTKTLIVFSGSAQEAHQFMLATHLNPNITTLFPDPSMQVALRYHAPVCPRVFVLDGQQRILYTNDHHDDAPQKANGITIALHALDALSANKKGN